MSHEFQSCLDAYQKRVNTALDKYLREHNDICMALKKEIHFFDKDKNFTNNLIYQLRLKKYHSYFKFQSKDQLLGEATSIYMYWYDAPKRIWQYNCDMSQQQMF